MELLDTNITGNKIQETLASESQGIIPIEGSRDENDDTEESISGSTEDIPPEKRRKTEIESMIEELKMIRLLREKALKMPMTMLLPEDDGTIPIQPSLNTVYESEESDEDDDSDQENASTFNQPTINFFSLPYQVKKVISFMEGCYIRLVLEKKLTKADVDVNRNRLSIPLSDIEVSFLNGLEEELLYTKKWIMVEMIEPNCSVNLITLSKWEMKKSGPCYVMITEWEEVMERNKLKEGDEIRLWSFRARGRPCFALVMV